MPITDKNFLDVFEALTDFPNLEKLLSFNNFLKNKLQSTSNWNVQKIENIIFDYYQNRHQETRIKVINVIFVILLYDDKNYFDKVAKNHNFISKKEDASSLTTQVFKPLAEIAKKRLDKNPYENSITYNYIKEFFILLGCKINEKDELIKNELIKELKEELAIFLDDKKWKTKNIIFSNLKNELKEEIKEQVDSFLFHYKHDQIQINKDKKKEAL